MNILHVVEDYSIESGGLRTVIKELDFYLKSVNINSFIIASKKEDEDKIKTVETNKPWLYSKAWRIELTSFIEVNSIDVVHIHGVWMYPQYIMAKICVEKNIPFIFTSHGMYEPWLWLKGRLKKKIYFHLVAKKYFSKANYIHAITLDELKNLKELFKTDKFIQIPNLISINSYAKNVSTVIDDKYILYLGRLDSKKGIDLLLKSFSKIKDSGFKLKIAGSFNPYKLVLDDLVKKLNIEDCVEFLGLIKGDQKTSIIKKAWTLVAPSHSEVIGMVNLEAAVLKTPVITTYQTGIERGWAKNGGILINPTENDLDIALKTVISWSEEQRNINGVSLFNFVKREYSWEEKLVVWEKAYENLTN